MTAVDSLSAQIYWSTSVATDGQVEYGTTGAYGALSPLQSNRTTSHVVSVGSLVPATLYHLRVRSRDASGNLLLSPDGTFRSLPVAFDFSSARGARGKSSVAAPSTSG
ncbi:MAG: hypothetical protein ABR576_11875 [Thermoanaerobaculia bacterium]